MGNQDYPLEHSIRRVSLVIRLLDDYTLEGPLGPVQVRLKGYETKPIKNLEGYYVFTNLPSGNYSVVVESAYYFPREKNVNTAALEAKNPVIGLVLLPHPGYPFEENTPLLRAVVKDSSGKGVPGAAVQAVVLAPDEACKARISSTPANAGEEALRLTDLAGSITPGDMLLIKDSPDGKQEICQITAPLVETPANQLISLTQPLKFGHPAKTPLMPVFNTYTSYQGEFVIYFRTRKVNCFTVKLTAVCPNYQTYNQEVEIAGNKSTSLGEIQLVTA